MLSNTTTISSTTERLTTVSRTDVGRGGAGVAPLSVLDEWTRVGLAQQRFEPPTRSTGRVSVRTCISGAARKNRCPPTSRRRSCEQRRVEAQSCKEWRGLSAAAASSHGDGTLSSLACTTASSCRAGVLRTSSTTPVYLAAASEAGERARRTWRVCCSSTCSSTCSTTFPNRSILQHRCPATVQQHCPSTMLVHVLLRE